LEKLIDAEENREYEFVHQLKDRNRGLILLLLDKIAVSGAKNLIEILHAWESIEYKKVRTRIQEVINELEKVEEQPKQKNKQEVISFAANKKWLSIPEDTRKQLERNVFCSHCLDVVQIEKYVVKESKGTIVLMGSCKTCGNEVARVID
jgi:hypothetical protein